MGLFISTLIYHPKENCYFVAMTDLIKLLPDHVANQIAAGEVIQRPASVVKELLENAIDAGSTKVSVIVKEGGKALIQVIDNGKGMSAIDALLCWERHATSKISAVEDIFAIRTMGFRGEALASIASVAMVEMKTRREADKVGTLIRIQGSEIKANEQTAAIEGTSITVKNLFYNVPARRNFLKSDAVEMRHIMDEFVRVALANPQVAMSLYTNDNESYNLKSGTAEDRIKDLFSHSKEGDLLPLHEQTTIATIKGFAGAPAIAKKTRGEQFFFVNNRFIKDPYLNHAVVSCYENLIQKEQFPFYVIYIDIDPAQIDVNVHPTKTEIKFEDERAVYQIVKATVKRSLGEHFHISTFEPTGGDIMPGGSGGYTGGSSRTDKGWQFDKTEKHIQTPKDWQELYSILHSPQTIGDLPKNQTYNTPLHAPQEEISSGTTKNNILQIHGRYILVQVKSGLLLIHQQRAHERVLYERYLRTGENASIITQQKLFPESIHVSASDEQLLLEILDEMRGFGIDISHFGKQTFIISGMPQDSNGHSEKELVLSLLEKYKDQAYASFKPHERMARIMAAKLCIQSGQLLNPEEMTSLTDELFACSEPSVSPDGSPVTKLLKLEELDKLMFSN